MSKSVSAWVAERLAGGEGVILISVDEARGSVPREAGTVMAVSAGDSRGTIGGGRLEFEAMALARRLLAEGRSSDRLDLPLGPAVGQCCGGHVAVALARADAAVLEKLEEQEREAAAAEDQVVVFGAGHVGQALVAALEVLPLRVIWCDRRNERFPPQTSVEIDNGDPLAVVSRAEAGSAVVVMTHDHGLDYEITEAALRRGDLAYIGLIGSRTKARRFERWFVARGNDPRLLDDLVCPIGEGAGRDKRPAVIAALTAAEVLTVLADHKQERQGAVAARLSGKAKR